MRRFSEDELAKLEAEMAELPEPIIDDENPEWTEADFRNARPASEVLAPEVIAAFRRAARGRPVAVQRKQQVTLRLDPDVLEGFRAGGPGWQTRINDALKRALTRA